MSKLRKKNNAVYLYSKWYSNVFLATHGRISVAATVCAFLNMCWVFLFLLMVLNILSVLFLHISVAEWLVSDYLGISGHHIPRLTPHSLGLPSWTGTEEFARPFSSSMFLTGRGQAEVVREPLFLKGAGAEPYFAVGFL